MKTIGRLALIAALSACSFIVHAEEAKKEAAAAVATKDTGAVDNSSPKDSKSQMVCKSERVTGSRHARKVCHTREELEMMKRAGRETVEKIQEMPQPLKTE